MQSNGVGVARGVGSAVGTGSAGVGTGSGTTSGVGSAVRLGRGLLDRAGGEREGRAVAVGPVVGERIAADG